MKRYDICELKRKGAYRHVLVLQADALADLSTRVVTPLIPADAAQLVPVLNPTFDVGGKRMMALCEQIVTVSSTMLGRVVRNAAEHDYAISRALDLVFKGF